MTAVAEITPEAIAAAQRHDYATRQAHGYWARVPDSQVRRLLEGAAAHLAVTAAAPRGSLPADPADREATVKGELLGIVSGYGGERIVAGPPMERMVDELAVLVIGWMEP